MLKRKIKYTRLCLMHRSSRNTMLDIDTVCVCTLEENALIFQGQFVLINKLECRYRFSMLGLW